MSLFLFPFISLSYLLFPLDFGSILPAHLLMHPSHSGQEQFYHFLSLLHFINSIDPRIPSYLIWLSFMAARPCHIKAISILTKHANQTSKLHFLYFPLNSFTGGHFSEFSDQPLCFIDKTKAQAFERDKPGLGFQLWHVNHYSPKPSEL